jgi:hypothetical protein
MTKETFKRVLDVVGKFKNCPLPSEVYSGLLTEGFSEAEATEIINTKVVDMVGLFTLADFLEVMREDDEPTND